MIIKPDLKKQLAEKLGKERFVKTLLNSGTKPEVAEILWEDYLQFFIGQFLLTCYTSLSLEEQDALWTGIDRNNNNISESMPIILARTEQMLDEHPDMFDTEEVISEIIKHSAEQFKLFIEEKYKK